MQPSHFESQLTRTPPQTPHHHRPCSRPPPPPAASTSSSSSGAGAGTSQLAFHTTVGPAPHNPYQSRSFRKRDRKPVAQPHEALLRSWGVTSAEYARVRSTGPDAESQLPDGLRRELGML